MKLKHGTGTMTTDKIKAFYWVLTWKLLFSDGWIGINKFLASGRTTPIPQKGKPCYYTWNLLYAFTNMNDFFITHGRGLCYAVPSRNLLNQNLFLKAVCLCVIVFDQVKGNIMNLLRWQPFIASNLGLI